MSGGRGGGVDLRGGAGGVKGFVPTPISVKEVYMYF